MSNMDDAKSAIEFLRGLVERERDGKWTLATTCIEPSAVREIIAEFDRLTDELAAVKAQIDEPTQVKYVVQVYNSRLWIAVETFDTHDAAKVYVQILSLRALVGNSISAYRISTTS